MHILHFDCRKEIIINIKLYIIFISNKMIYLIFRLKLWYDTVFDGHFNLRGYYLWLLNPLFYKKLSLYRPHRPRLQASAFKTLTSGTLELPGLEVFATVLLSYRTSDKPGRRWRREWGLPRSCGGLFNALEAYSIPLVLNLIESILSEILM